MVTVRLVTDCTTAVTSNRSAETWRVRGEGGTAPRIAFDHIRLIVMAMDRMTDETMLYADDNVICSES